MDQDSEHLRLLSLFHYIQGGISAATSCFFIIYIFMGLLLTAGSAVFHGRNGPPAFIGVILTVIGSVAVLVGWTFAALTIYAGRCLAQRKHRIFCMVVAVINCLFLPYGTILGIFALIVLQRPSVEAMFDRAAIVA